MGDAAGETVRKFKREINESVSTYRQKVEDIRALESKIDAAKRQIQKEKNLILGVKIDRRNIQKELFMQEKDFDIQTKQRYETQQLNCFLNDLEELVGEMENKVVPSDKSGTSHELNRDESDLKLTTETNTHALLRTVVDTTKAIRNLGEISAQFRAFNELLDDLS